mmetsp:Transcript_17983/g.15905  ORF Transcript_17983/g.15905 Transcript_17983/m.15905 type:complete len:108 (+) Transcript_17983:909-1232(+)
MEISRIILVWAFFLIYTGHGHETFNYIQFIGFVAIVLGTIVFNELIVPGLFSFNSNTKENIAKRMQKDEFIGLLEEDSTEEMEKNKLNASKTNNDSSTLSQSNKISK